MSISLKQLSKTNRILIIRLSAIGDVIRTLPAVHALRQELPEAYLGWVLENAPYSLIKGHPEIDKFYVFPKNQIQQAIKECKFREAVRLLKAFAAELKAEQFEIAIDMQNLFKSGIVTLLSGAKIRIGYRLGREGSKFFLTHTVPPPEESCRKMLFVDWQLELVRRLGVEVGAVRFILPDYSKEEVSVNNFLSKHKITGNFFCLAPGTSWPTKSWSPEGMAGLADRLGDYGRVLIIGSESDQKICKEVLGLAKTDPVDAVAAFNLRELAVLLRKTKLFLGGDTGPMHLAVAVGTHVIAWFGPTDPLLNGPYQAGITINLNLPCQPCHKRRCDSKQCMTDLSLERVWEAVQPFL